MYVRQLPLPNDLFFYLKITTDCFIVAKLDLPFKNVISAVKCWVNPFVLHRS